MKASQTGLVIFKKGRKKIIAGNFRHMIPAFFEKYWHFFSFSLQRSEAWARCCHDLVFFYFFQICVEKQNAKSSVSSTHFWKLNRFEPARPPSGPRINVNPHESPSLLCLPANETCRFRRDPSERRRQTKAERNRHTKRVYSAEGPC